MLKPIVLLTGAAGFIGSNVLEQLQGQNFEVIAVDALIESNYGREPKLIRWEEAISKFPKTKFIVGDLRDSSFTRSLPTADYVIHEAAVPGLNLSWENFPLYESCNVTATQNLIEYAISREVKRFVLASTSSVYGREAIGDEESSLQPVSPYGVTKLAAEKLVLAYAANFLLPYSILRYFSVYGDRQRPDMAYSIFCENLVKGQAINIYGDGNQTRTNTHVRDVARVTINSMLSQHMENQIVNIAGETELTINAAIDILEGALKLKCSRNFMHPRKGDQTRTAGNIDKAKKLGIHINSIDIKDGLTAQALKFRADFEEHGLGI
jgi:UDP-glucuronate 4-epimerase